MSTCVYVTIIASYVVDIAHVRWQCERELPARIDQLSPPFSSKIQTKLTANNASANWVHTTRLGVIPLCHQKNMTVCVRDVTLCVPKVLTKLRPTNAGSSRYEFNFRWLFRQYTHSHNLILLLSYHQVLT